MTRKFKYHLQENKFEELPGMEEPDATKILGDSPSGADYEVLDDLMDDYRAHLFTLRDGKHNPMIDGSPECKEVFEDGQVVEKGKEIQIMPYSCNEVHCRCGYSTPVAQHCVSRRDRVVPVLPTDEDKIWNELISKLAALELFAKVKPTNADGIENWKRGKIAELKKQYHVNKITMQKQELNILQEAAAEIRQLRKVNELQAAPAPEYNRDENSPQGKAAIAFYNWMESAFMSNAKIPLEIKWRMFADQKNANK